MDTPAQDPGPDAKGSARTYTRELRIPRNATVVALLLGVGDRSWLRVEMKDSSENGLGLRALVPFPAGVQVALSVVAPDSAPELLRCSVQHCTRQNTGRYDVGLKILERMPGALNTVRIPEAWVANATQRSAG